MSKPLTGVRVVDFGRHIAGPLVAVMLADQGADVVHVDAPGAPGADVPPDAFYNRGKRRITLDLRDDRDRDIARRLVTRADVLVENFRPGVMDRFGLGWDALKDQAPRLIYCSLPGFAPEDPRAAVPAWEGVIDAATGNCRIRAGEAPEGWDTTRPTYSSVPIASDFAAFLGAVGVVSALVERCRSGRGQRVSVPLFDAVFEAIGDAGTYVTSRGLPPQRPLAQLGSGTYACADGNYVQFNPIGATPRFVTWFLQAAGHPEWTTDGDETVLRRRLTELFATRTAQEWEDLGHSAGVPLARIRTSGEWLATPHARASGAITCLDDPRLGPTWMAGVPVHVGDEQDDNGLDHPLEPRHLPDADRAGILGELDEPVAPPAEASGGQRERPMAGLRVLDLTQILAGPSCGRILAELGADVVKVNAPQRQIAAHGIVNRGKHTILLDVENPAGQEVFWRLVDDADVIVQNFPPGTAERYGIGYESVRARKPGIVHVSVSCYGGVGPWAQGRGYETQGQAVTGIMARAGGPGGKPAVLGPYNLLDYGTGVMAAFAASLGIYHHTVTGEGLRLRTSLAQTGTYHQAAYLLGYAGAEGGEPSGPAALGENALQRFYRADDGWFFLGATDAQQLRTIDGLDGAFGDEATDHEIAIGLENRFALRPATFWVGALQAAGIGAHQVMRLDALMTDPLVRARQLSIAQTSEEVGEVTMPGVAIGLSATPSQAGDPVRRPGADAVQVLEQIGLGASIEHLERRWAVQTAALPHGWNQ
ncbi:CaiB/BaiF CoA transferase family protein [Amycolatopsis pigmentata]|uniref:CaiB/BaiF CoA transferase family protein n=1 Tax=Amycolatopsis pigmentata TaxID=450801 RepID=A0ABW5FNG6_9PSEU